MVKKQFTTADGCSFATRSKAEQHEASIAVSEFIKDHCENREGDDATYDLEEVTNLLINYSNEIITVVQRYKDAKEAQDFTREEVQAYVVQELIKVVESGGDAQALTLPNIWRATEVAWDHLVNSNSDSCDDEMHVSIAERAWDHFQKA